MPCTSHGLRRIAEAGGIVSHAKGVYYEWVRTLAASREFERDASGSGRAARLRALSDRDAVLPSPPCSTTKRSSCSRRRSSTSPTPSAEPGVLDNVEDLLTDVITSPRFDSEVFTLERSLQVMLGPRAGTTLVGLLTVAPEVFDEVAEVRIPSEVHERLVAWRARFGLAIDNALNFLNNPDGIQGHNFATQVAHVEERRVLQGRLTLVRYNNEPQFFVADASVFLGLVTDILERLGPYLESDAVDAETVARLRDALGLVERKTGGCTAQAMATSPASKAPRCATSTSPRPARTAARPRSASACMDGFQRRGLSTGFIKPVGQRTVIEDGVPADEDAVLMKTVFGLARAARPR